jgi:nucleoid DNA-binding protein
MNKNELAARLARREGVSRAVAADRLDQVVHHILARLRRGESVSLPGLGAFRPAGRTGFTFDPERPGRRGK